MTSDKQAKANRRNALKSTGPKTPEGKSVVRYNATKHGLLSREVLLPGEDEEALKELDENLRAELQAVGELENMLVDRIVSALWRLRRLGRVEIGMNIRLAALRGTVRAGAGGVPNLRKNQPRRVSREPVRIVYEDNRRTEAPGSPLQGAGDEGQARSGGDRHAPAEPYT